MIEHIWSVLCTRSIINRDSNNITLFEVVERLHITGPAREGATPTQLELVTLWGRTAFAEPTRGRSRIRLLAPDGNEIDEPKVIDVDLTRFHRMRNRLLITSIPIRDSGNYVFVIEKQEGRNWNAAARTPLEVVVEIEAAPAAAQPAS